MFKPRDTRAPRAGAGARQAASELLRAWNAAADRAFPAGIHQPEIYLRTTRIVGAVAGELRRRGAGVEPLLDAWREHGALVRQAAEPAGTEGLDVEAIAGAAFAMRYREVLEEIILGDRLAALAEAGPDAGWLVLEESGHRPGDPFVPYRRLEADPATGRALLVTTRPDETFTACVHVVEEGSIDPQTGRLSAGEPGTSGYVVHETTSAEEREALVARLRHAATGATDVTADGANGADGD